MVLKAKFALLSLCSILAISGCQNSRVYAPVSSVGATSKYHVVRRGDSLYSIAFRYGKDYLSLARQNRIAPPYTILIGQKIAIGGSGTTAGRMATRKAAAREKKAKQKMSRKPVQSKHSNSQMASGSLKWHWPMKGEILKRFDGKMSKGIDIAGTPGARVSAAADGVVVYAGGNLRGYGKLVIVKHNDHFLSAYGNNRKIRVKEGERVKAGQKLAEAGTSSSNVEMLHFEIRRDGKPRDPIGYLPKN